MGVESINKIYHILLLFTVYCNSKFLRGFTKKIQVSVCVSELWPRLLHSSTVVEDITSRTKDRGKESVANLLWFSPIKLCSIHFLPRTHE